MNQIDSEKYNEKISDTSEILGIENLIDIEFELMEL
jgi:hypothetical protein